MSYLIKRLILNIIRFYQRYVSPQGYCRFTPTCSEYVYQAIDRYGILYGSWKGIMRIMRCHPWNKGGFDPL